MAECLEQYEDEDEEAVREAILADIQQQAAKRLSGALYRRPLSPQKFESSQPFGSSSPTPMSNPFLLEDEEDDPLEASVSIDTSRAPVAGVVPFLKTAKATTSDGKPIRIGRRKRRLSETKFEIQHDSQHASKSKHFGIEIHTLLDHCSSLLPSDLQAKECDQVGGKTAAQEKMWVDKYRPKKFTELLGDERTNREVMRWIKHWDYCVFGRPILKSKISRDTVPEPSSDPHNRPHRKLLMLTGPPGFGKTTLAHIAAKQAGYDVIEVNASDDRTGAIVHNKIGDALESQAVFSPRPSLVIIDEIDGVSGSGGEAGFIRSLLKFVADDEKATQRQEKLKFEDSKLRRKGKKRPTKALLRPIICICNDQYVAALRPLRQYCQIVHFNPSSTATVVTRLRTICHTEGLQADVRALNALCELTQSDMRSCVNSLQYVRMNSRHFNLESLTSTLAKRDVSQSSHSVVESVFKLLDAKKERKKGQQALDKDHVGRIADLAMTNNEYSKILNGCFAYYPLAPYHDSLFSKPSAGSDWLFFYDQCERGVYERQHGELMMYMPYPVSAFHNLFATHECKSSLERSKKDFEAREKLRINTEVLSGWISSVRPAIRQLFTPLSFATELVSYGLRIIGTNLNPANAHLIKTSERLALAKVVDGMIGLGLSYTQYKVDDGSYIFRLEPPVCQILDYEGVVVLKGESLLPARYAARQVIASELAAEKIRRSMDINGAAIVPEREVLGDVSTKKRKRDLDEQMAEPVSKKDFFGRPIALTKEGSSSGFGSKVPEKAKAKVYIKFSDGFSDAVRNNISIKELINI